MIYRYVGLINSFLLICVGFIVVQIVDVWNDDYKTSTPDDSKTDLSPKDALKVTKRPHHPRRYYEHVIKKNLFRPERNEWKPFKKEPESTDSTTSHPEVVVYGIVICDDLEQAWVRVKQQATKRKRRPSQNSRIRWGDIKKITEGDTLGGWVVKDIEPETIYLSQGENTIEYSLIEPGKPKQRVVPRTSYKKTRKEKHYSRSKAKPQGAKKRTMQRRRLKRWPTKKRTLQ